MLFIMRGTSCSGKDTFANKHFPDTANHLSSDFFRQMLLGNINDQRNSDQVFGLMYQILETRFQHKAEWTVLNATNLRMRDLQKPIELCKKYHVPFTILSIEPPPVPELMRRNQHRYATGGDILIPDNVLHRHYERYYNCMPAFIEEAVNNEYCSFIEFDQTEQVLRHVS